MKLSVLSVAYPFAPVGTDAVGGAEQVLSSIDSALVNAGHQSIVVAAEGSQTAGTLISVAQIPGALTTEARRTIRERQADAIEDAIRRFNPDCIHMHGIDFFEYLPAPGVPVLVTLHLPSAWYPEDVFRLDRPNTFLHCVSASQRQKCPPFATLLPEIENGVSLDDFPFRRHKQEFALTLGRICPEKNFHVALDAAAHAGIRILLAGQVFPYDAHERYFREDIFPRLDARCHFIGPIGLERKRRLLGAARCLLIPSLAPETSSLVAMEAFACGTPVIAFRSGALPEIVEHGVTGFLVNDEQEMADAITRCDAIDPEVCRATAERRFSLKNTITKYFAAYGTICARKVQGHVSHVRSIEVEKITSTPELEKLRNGWAELWCRDSNATPFQSPEWLIPWWRNIGEGELYTLAVRNSGRLVGILPAYIYTKPDDPTRTVYLLGTGTTDYLDGIFEDRWRQLSVEAAIRFLKNHEDSWDVCDFQQLRDCSPLHQEIATPSLIQQQHNGEECPAICLPETLEQLSQVVPTGMLKQFQYSSRRAERMGELRFEAAGQRNLEQIRDAFFNLHQQRWETRGSTGVLRDAVRRFHSESMPQLLNLGVLRLYALSLNGQIIATLYGLVDRRTERKRFYFYLSGFDPEHRRLSPGTLMIGHVIEQALREGSRVFDFLRGCEPYKYAWGARNSSTYRVMLRHASVCSR